MKLKEIEIEFDHSWDENLGEWAVNYGAKLIEVAKAAKELITRCQCCNSEELMKSLDELEKPLDGF